MRRYNFLYEVTTDIDGSLLSDGTISVEASNQSNAMAQAQKHIYNTDRFCDPNMDPVINLTLESVEDINAATEPHEGVTAG